MPEGVSVTTISLLGKDREFRGSLKTIKTVRKVTGHNLLSPAAREVIQNNLDEIMPAMLFHGTEDHEGFESIDDLNELLNLGETIQLIPIVFAALGLKAEVQEKN